MEVLLDCSKAPTPCFSNYFHPKVQPIMKKITFLLFIALLPVFGFGQVVDLATWKTHGNGNATVSPGVQLTAGNMTTSSNVNLEHQTWSGFRIYNNGANSNVYNDNYYTQFSITPDTNYSINLSSFEFLYNLENDNARAKKVRVRYSTTSDFSSNVSQLADVNLLTNSTNQLLVLNFPANTQVLSGSTLYIRMHIFGNSNSGWSEIRIRNASYPTGWTSHNGPTLKGTISGTLLTAINDTATVNKNTATDISVLTNDAQGSAPINSVQIVTQPTNAGGTVSMNANNTAHYVPATGFTGLTSFTYKINNGIDPESTATVNINVVIPAPSGPLCGTYVIGSTPQTEYYQFTTITQAVSYLNTNGVSCPVTFLLNDAAYTSSTETFPITINEFTGSSNVNTVTFKPLVNSTIESNQNSVFVLNDADNIIIDGESKLNLYVNKSANEQIRRVVWLQSVGNNRVNDGANYNTFKNLTLTQTFNGTGQIATGIYSSRSNGAGGVNSHTMVQNVIFSNGSHAIYVDGNSASGANVTQDWTIKDIQLSYSGSNKPLFGIYFNNISGYTISNNNLSNIEKNTSGYSAVNAGAIYIAGNYSENGNIFSNTISNVFNNQNNGIAVGIYVTGSSLISNNSIYNIRSNGGGGIDSQNGFGMFLNNSSSQIYYNTVKLSSNQNSGTSSAIYIKSGTITLKNNIFINAQTAGSNRYAIYNAGGTFASNGVTNNNYYSTQHVGYSGGNKTFAEWVALTGEGSVVSKNIQPSFVSTTDLHLATDEAPNDVLIGTPISGITADIDGDVRNTTAPKMGADEFRVCSSSIASAYTGSWNVADPTHTAAEIDLSLTLQNSLTLCSLTVKENQVVTVPANTTLTVYGDVVVETGGQIIVENNGSFVQVDDNATFTGDNESFLMKRETQPVFRLDFTYYSSPIKEVSDFTLKKLSPLTLASKYYSWNEAIQGWAGENANTRVMEEGRGYIVRAPQTFDLQGQVGAVAKKDTINFVGLPNNGEINFENIQGSTTVSKWNLIGNPYPSALSIDEFYKNSINSTNLEGTIYLWTHNTPQNDNGTGIYSYSPSDYASYNRSGGVATAAESELNDGDNVPTGFVAAGQSFFVKGIVEGTSTVTFNNSMRVAGNNNQFFRPGTQEPVNNWDTTGKHRVWLNLTGGTNAFNQALVGYIEGATDALDWGFDGDQFGGNQVTLYSLLDTKKLTIQGRALPFNDQDEVPLGYKTTLTGTLKIAIDHFDGLFNGQDIYLEDKTLNIVHNLKEADYTFTTVPGTFNDRFVLRYVPAAELGTDNPTVDANSMVIFRDGSQINIKSNDQTIEHVTVYDLLGKVIFDKGSINAQSFSTAQLNVSNQVVIVKVITDTQAEVVKKVIMN